jgi:hypothetical protein
MMPHMQGHFMVHTKACANGHGPFARGIQLLISLLAKIGDLVGSIMAHDAIMSTNKEEVYNTPHYIIVALIQNMASSSQNQMWGYQG